MKRTKRTSWAAVFAKHQSTLAGFFRSRVGHRWDAQDLTQEVYLRLLRADERELIRNPEGYLRTVATNLLREHAVLQQRAAQSLELLEDAEGGSSLAKLIDEHEPEDEVEREWREHQIEALLSHLPAKCRAVLIMQHREDMTYQDIARKLGVSTHMVKKYVVRALSLCRQSLKRDGEQQ